MISPERQEAHARMVARNRRIARGVAFAVLGLVVFIFSSCIGVFSTHTVPPGTVAVRTCWGKLESNHFLEGFYRTGINCEMHEMSIRTQTYTMAGAGRIGHVDGAVSIVTRDQIALPMDVSVQFHLNPSHAIGVYRAFGPGYDADMVHVLVRGGVRDAAGQFEALAMNTQREAVQAAIEATVRAHLVRTLHGRGLSGDSILIDNIVVRDADLPASIDEASANVLRERQLTAQRTQAVQTAQQTAAANSAEANGRSEVSRIDAERTAANVRIAAQGESDAVRARADATAYSNRTINASLTPTVLRYMEIEAMRAMLGSNGTRTIMLPSGMHAPTLMMPAP